MIVRGIGVLSLAKILGVLYAVFGLIAGFFLTTVSLAGLAFTEQSGMEGLLAGLFGIGTVIILPTFYGATGFVAGLITAGLFNFVAPMVGGLELQLDSPPTRAGGATYPQPGNRPAV